MSKKNPDKLINRDLVHQRLLLLLSPLATARAKLKSSYELSKQKHEGELITVPKYENKRIICNIKCSHFGYGILP